MLWPSTTANSPSTVVAWGSRDASLLDSALARPQPLHAYGDPAPDLADLAASIAFGLARNHPFLDGNTHTAHVCYRVFLSLNGAELIASDEDRYLNMLTLAEGSMAEAEFAAWLREHLQMSTTGAGQQTRRRIQRQIDP